MTPTEAGKILEDVSYKDGWRLVIRGSADGFYLQVRFIAPNGVTGVEEEWGGRKWVLSRYMTKSEIVTTAFKAIITAEEHETRELFKYRNAPIFGPHFNVDMMADLIHSEGLEGLEDARQHIELNGD